MCAHTYVHGEGHTTLTDGNIHNVPLLINFLTHATFCLQDGPELPEVPPPFRKQAHTRLAKGCGRC